MGKPSRLALLLFLVLAPPALCEKHSTTHVEIEYAGVDSAYPAAIARILETVREEATSKLGFDLPEKIRVLIRCGPEETVRLFTDGSDNVTLLIRNEKDLHKPAATGIFNLYGFCHEVGHMCMYRLIKERSWLSGDAAEAWAHYFGSRMVDIVFEEQGPDLWPDQYDYRSDGMQRFNSKRNSSDPFSQACTAWEELAGIAKDSGIAAIFRAWDAAGIDPFDPIPSLAASLKKSKNAAKLGKWLKEHGSAIAVPLEKSPFETKSAGRRSLKGKPEELARDDGTSAGKQSWPGAAGQAVLFEIGPKEVYVTEIKVYGSLYGSPGSDTFKLWLCDEEFRPFACHAFSFSKFSGEPQWVSLEIEPTLVPPRFFAVTCYNATQFKGVYMHFDAESSGSSFSGPPGGERHEWSRGDWMIRAVVCGK